MQVQSHEDLLAWQAAMRLAETVYHLTRAFPPDELYGMRSQMRRAAVSVASNIAEGHARLTTGEYKRFLGIARGSLAELNTQIKLSIRLGYLDHEAGETLLKQIAETGRLTNGLVRALNRKLAAEEPVGANP